MILEGGSNGIADTIGDDGMKMMIDKLNAGKHIKDTQPKLLKIVRKKIILADQNNVNLSFIGHTMQESYNVSI